MSKQLTAIDCPKCKHRLLIPPAERDQKGGQLCAICRRPDLWHFTEVSGMIVCLHCNEAWQEITKLLSMLERESLMAVLRYRNLPSTKPIEGDE